MALYNLFRPMSWDAVIGQDGIVETLKNAVATGEISSTYLFHGPRGTGKTTCARIFAKALNCESPISPGIPCGKCRTCMDIANDTAPNVVEIDAACFQRDVRVRLSNGKSMRIGDIVDKMLSVEVLSYNFETKSIEPKQVIGWYKNGSSDKFYNILLDAGYGEKRCISGVTLNHEVYDENGVKKPLSSFKVNDYILYKCNTINDVQRSILVGTFLGDSSLSGGNKYGIGQTNRNIILSCSHNEKQWGYLEYKANLFKNIGAEIGNQVYENGYGGYFRVLRTNANEYLSRLKDLWIKDDVITDELIQSIDEISLAFWYMDDGTFSDPEKKSALRLCTNAYNEDEVDRLVDFLNNKWEFGAIKSSAERDNRVGEFVINIGRSGGKKFFELIKEYIHPEMYYKLPIEYQGYFKDISELCLKNEEIIPVKIVDIKPFVKGRKKEKSFIRYDIEVKDNHNYFVGRGVLVSNSNTGVDNMRDVKLSANNVAAGGGWKVFIIDESHMLSKAAQNAALKMFEESPQHTIFILCTTELNKMEGTIISRSLRFDFRPVTIENIVKRLEFIASQKEMKYDEAALKLIAKAANGGMRDSISILERVSIENAKNVCVSAVTRSLGIIPTDIMVQLSRVITGDYKAGFGVVESIISSGYDTYQFFMGGVDFFRDMMLVKMGMPIVAEKEVIDNLQSIVGNVSIDKITGAISILEDSMNRYKYTDNKQILLEVAMYRIASTSSSQPGVNIEQLVSEAISRIDFRQYIPQVQVIQQQPVVFEPPVPPPVVNQFVPQAMIQVPLTSALLDSEWEQFLEVVKGENEDCWMIMRMAKPLPFDRNCLPLSFGSEYAMYAEIFNDEYRSNACRILSRLMSPVEMRVEAVIAQSNGDTIDSYTLKGVSISASNGGGERGGVSERESSPLPYNEAAPVVFDNGVGQVVGTQSNCGAPSQSFCPSSSNSYQSSSYESSDVPLSTIPDDAPVTEDIIHEKFGYGSLQK